jgi:hypothetical protein
MQIPWFSFHQNIDTNKIMLLWDSAINEQGKPCGIIKRFLHPAQLGVKVEWPMKLRGKKVHRGYISDDKLSQRKFRFHLFVSATTSEKPPISSRVGETEVIHAISRREVFKLF